MKTMNEFIKELTAKKELQEEMSKIKNNDELAAFLKANDCEATPEEFSALVEIARDSEGEISDELAEAVAGGFPWGMSNPVEIQSSDDAAGTAAGRRIAETPAERLRKLGLIKGYRLDQF